MFPPEPTPVLGIALWQWECQQAEALILVEVCLCCNRKKSHTVLGKYLFMRGRILQKGWWKCRPKSPKIWERWNKITQISALSKQEIWRQDIQNLQVVGNNGMAALAQGGRHDRLLQEESSWTMDMAGRSWLEMQEVSIWLTAQLSQGKQRRVSLQLPFIHI